MFQRVRVLERTGRGVCFHWFKTHCGHRSTAGFRASNPEMSVQFRLAAFHFKKHTSRASRAARSPKPRLSGAAPGRRAIHFQQPRSSQAVRQRFHTPRIAGSNPASATSFRIGDDGSEMVDAREAAIHSLQPSPIRNPLSTIPISTSRARESANPPRLGRGGTRGSTGARDHFQIADRGSEIVDVRAFRPTIHNLQSTIPPAPEV